MRKFEIFYSIQYFCNRYRLCNIFVLGVIMKASELIKQLEKLIDKDGDKELKIYNSFIELEQHVSSLENSDEDNVFYLNVY